MKMAGSKPKLLSLDAFAKTVEDAKVKTASGGIITLVCVLVVLLLIRNEYSEYTLVVNRPELVVDRDVNRKLDINIDITFPNLPCDLVTLDILDVSGDTQADVLKSGFEKYRLIPSSNEEVLDNAPVLRNDLLLEDIAKNPNKEGGGFCGSCYGALPQGDNEYCCNDCETVRLAYAEKMWAFYDGANIEQCENEGYVTRLNQRIEQKEGCRIKGTAQINRVSGNMHFAPGYAKTSPGRHIHDLSLYEKHFDKFNFDHVINHLSFGLDPVKEDTNHQSTHPLDGFRLILNDKSRVISYYLKVVATRFEFLSGLAMETNQFSAIPHHRPYRGGKDEDHHHTLHAKGGIPGVFFHFDISPMKIINKEQYAKTWSGFVLGVISSIAGVLTVGAVLDRSVWAAEKAIKSKKDI